MKMFCPSLLALVASLVSAKSIEVVSAKFIVRTFSELCDRVAAWLTGAIAFGFPTQVSLEVS